MGVKRALDRTLDIPLRPETTAFGEAFERFVILEVTRLASYRKKDCELSYLLTKDGAEIDLIIDLPGQPKTLVEIKSKDHVDERDTRSLEHFRDDFKHAKLCVLSRDPRPKRIGNVSAMRWEEGIELILK